MVAVCDVSAERRGHIRRWLPTVEVSDSVDGVLRNGDVEAVVISTEATAHYPIADLCLRAGRHVLVEKPVATRTADARALLEVAEKTGKTLMVGHTFLYNEGIRKVKEYVTDGSIGRLYYMYSRRTNLGPIRRDVNAIWDLAPHDVSIFNYLLAETPEWASAVGVCVLDNREDVGFVSLRYPSGVVGHIHVSWADPNKVREVVVVGSDMRVVFDDLELLETVRVYEKGVAAVEESLSERTLEVSGRPIEYQDLLVRDGDIISPRIERIEPLRAQCSHFLECITTGSSPLTGGQEGLHVVQTMEAIDRSMAANGAPVRVDPNSRGH
jgi:predicted dehydrogenase